MPRVPRLAGRGLPPIVRRPSMPVRLPRPKIRLRRGRPAFDRFGVPASARTSVDEWRTFGHPRYRTFQGIGSTAAVVFALASDGLTIPLLLALGTPAALATLIGLSPNALSAAQLLVPDLLRRTNGNLRGLTLLILAFGETRGFLLAAVVILYQTGILPGAAAIAAIAAVYCLAGAASSIGGANLQAWYRAILPERERRFVSPRVQGITQGLGAVLLLPVALGIQVGLGTIGLGVYAIVFAAAGLSGVGELFVVRRLPHPGRVRVAARGAAPPKSRETVRFIRANAIGAFGAGFGPYLSIYAISVLGLPPGFAIVLSAVSAAASLASATIVGGWLHRGSASRTLRLSFVMRGSPMILGLAAFPANPFAWLVLCVVAAMASAGWAMGTLAANERLLRLTGGSNLIGAQASFVAQTAAGLTGGQVCSASLLAVLPIAYPTYAILFTVSGLVRLVLSTRVEVGPSWATATAAFNVDELKQGR